MKKSIETIVNEKTGGDGSNKSRTDGQYLQYAANGVRTIKTNPKTVHALTHPNST